MGHSDAQIVLAQDQEQVDKMLEIRDQIPQVQRVIYWDGKGLWDYDDPWLMTLDAVRELGRDLLTREPDRFEQEVEQGQKDDIALICYTSGTTGLPKGAMLSHDNLLLTAQLSGEVDPRKADDDHVSFLPLGWVAEHIVGFASHCLDGLIINFPEAPETVRENVREVAPDGLVYSARLWDSLVSIVQVRMQDATWINRQLYTLCMPVGRRAADKLLQGEPLPLGLKMQHWFANRLFFAPLRDQLGLSQVRTALTGGAALSPDVMRFFHGMGVNLKQVYGSTEVATAGTIHRNGDIKLASVGKPYPQVSIRIAEDGEIQINTPTLFQGYYKAPDKTEEAIHVEEDGTRWFLTGDAGYLDDDGHLIYLDRVKDMITLSNKERFSPQFIEGRLKFSPYIQDVMAVGDPTREHVAALIIIDFDSIGKWAEQKRIGYTTFADLSQKSEVLALVKEVVIELNESLPPAGRVQSFVLMHKEFDADESEMTRSRKLRRGVLADRYNNIIEALYSQQSTVAVQSPITYQDGTQGMLETEIAVVRL